MPTIFIERVATMQGRIPREQFLLGALKISIVLSSLDAISIGPIPFGWISVYLVIFTSIIGRANFAILPRSIYVFLSWAFFVQFLSLSCLGEGRCIVYEMPQLSTTPYFLYITLRYLPFLMLIAVVATIDFSKRKFENFIEFIISAGAGVSIIALYVYAAHLYGLPDIPRTRLGTDGREVEGVAFTYSFHRALGTFREPSGMAIWLLLPFFLSLKKINWKSIVIGLAILLSGSMSAFVAIAGGVFFGAIYIFFRSVKEKKWLFRLPFKLGLVVIIALSSFSLLVKKEVGYSGLSGVISERLGPVLMDGVEESNRGYVFQFAADVGIPVLGHGLGNSNLLLTKWMHSDAVAGMLSFYLNILMSVGYVGAFFMALVFSAPFFFKIRMYSVKDVFYLHAAYFSWLVGFVIHSAEIPLMFAVCYGLLFTFLKNKWCETQVE